MMILRLLLLLFIFSGSLNAQDTIKIGSEGEKLKNLYLSFNVETLWQSGHHVDWETGLPDKPNAKQGIKTHCSAFVAGACKKLGLYILRPPQHGQVLLANAQHEWLTSMAAEDSGWVAVNSDSTYITAQRLANEGYVVVAVRKNPNKKQPGHIAFVMPQTMTREELLANGPEMTMASTKNYNFISFKKGFKHDEWPDKSIPFYYNKNTNFLKHDK